MTQPPDRPTNFLKRRPPFRQPFVPHAPILQGQMGEQAALSGDRVAVAAAQFAMAVRSSNTQMSALAPGLRVPIVPSQPGSLAGTTLDFGERHAESSSFDITFGRFQIGSRWRLAMPGRSSTGAIARKQRDFSLYEAAV